MSALRVNSGTGNGKSPRWTFHFRVGSGRRTGSSGRFGNGGLEGRGFLDGSCSRPDMRLLSERSATSANDRDFTSGYCQKGSDRQTPAALATKPLIAKTLHDRRGGVESSTHGLSSQELVKTTIACQGAVEPPPSPSWKFCKRRLDCGVSSLASVFLEWCSKPLHGRHTFRACRPRFLFIFAGARVGCAVQASNDPRQLKRPLLDFPRSQVAWLFKLTVNPLLNSAGRHAHEIRLRLAVRNGIADLELPFPQPRLYLGKAEFNTPAVHV